MTTAEIAGELHETLDGLTDDERAAHRASREDTDPVTEAIEAAAASAYTRLLQARRAEAGTDGYEPFAALYPAAYLGAHLEALRQTILLATQPKPTQALTRAEREHVQMIEEVLGVTQAQLSREHGALTAALAALESIATALAAPGPLSRDLTDELAGIAARVAKQGRTLVAPVVELVEPGR